MGRVFVVTSGKGGVGKSTVVANLGLSLAMFGKKIVVVDLDIGLNNLDVVLGVESQVVQDVCDLLENKCRIKQTLIQISGLELYVLPSSKFLEKSMLKFENVSNIIAELSKDFDYVLIDSPAGIDMGFKLCASVATESLVVVTPHLSSIRDADKVLSLLSVYNHFGTYLVVNRIRSDMVARKEMISAFQIGELLKTKVVGVVPESDDISLNAIFESGIEKKAFENLASNLINEQFCEYNYLGKYKGFWGKIRANIKRRA